MGRRDRTVYATDRGRICPNCQRPVARCACRASPRAAPVGDGDGDGDGVVRVRRETRGRKGKTVTTITGVPLASNELRALAAELKRQCGSGGSAKGGVIEVQGDHAAALVTALEERGYSVKRAGG